MSGNREGAIKARDRMLARDKDFYSKLGFASWKQEVRQHRNTHLQGFGSMDREKFRQASAKGGRLSSNSEYYERKRKEDRYVLE